MNNELPKRKNIRLKNFDYSTTGAYFITICTNERRKILSTIVGGDVLDAPHGNSFEKPHIELSPYGEIADKYINQLDAFYDNIKVVKYVIMPNHIHIMLLVLNYGPSRTSAPTVANNQHSTVSCFVSTFKRFFNKECGCNIWQRQYNDHIIRNREDYQEHLEYIHNNPLCWHYDELYSEK